MDLSWKFVKTAVPLLAFCALCSAPAIGAETEEQRLIRISKQLKPISDNQWNEIAGSKSTEVYDIQKGDTLWDISKRLFGNPNYWAKVWSLNPKIMNPHVVEPGQKLVFFPGNSENTPSLSSASSMPSQTTMTSSSDFDAPRSGPHEYDKLPKELWAPQDMSEQFKKDYDEYGLEKDIKINIPSRFVFRVPAIANDTELPYLGEIIGSTRDGVGLSQHEALFLRSSHQDLQVGTTYSVLSQPKPINEQNGDRAGFIFDSLGEIKITGIHDELYSGIVTNSYDVIKRDDRVYPLLPSITGIRPIAAKTAIEALVIMNNEKSTQNTAQFHFVHFDRGIEDGVQVGNVFRIYDYKDPTTKQKLTDSDFLIHADALVVHATAQFSTALIIRSRNTLSRGDFGVLLTDVSDLEKQFKDRIHDLGSSDNRSAEDKDLDNLDFDNNDPSDLTDKERREIIELDHWDKTKDSRPKDGESTLPSPADQPTDEPEKSSPVAPQPESPPQLHPTPESAAPQPSPTLDQALDALPSDPQTPPPAPSSTEPPTSATPPAATPPAVEPAVEPLPEPSAMPEGPISPPPATTGNPAP